MDRPPPAMSFIILRSWASQSPNSWWEKRKSDSLLTHIQVCHDYNLCSELSFTILWFIGRNIYLVFVPVPGIELLQPLQLPKKWDKGVCMRAQSRQSSPTLCNPVNYGSPGFSVYGILLARILERVAMPSSRGSSWPGDQTCTSYVSCTGRWVLYDWCHLGSQRSLLLFIKVPSTTPGLMFLSLKWLLESPERYGVFARRTNQVTRGLEFHSHFLPPPRRGRTLGAEWITNGDLINHGYIMKPPQTSKRMGFG